MQIQISWLFQKPTDPDLHGLQRQGVSGFSRTRVNRFIWVCTVCHSASTIYVHHSSQMDLTLVLLNPDMPCLCKQCRSRSLIELGFNDTSTLVGHFVSSPREREKKDRRDSRGDEREGQGRKRNRNESEETEEIKISPSTLTCYKDSRPCPAVSQYQLGAPVT